MKRLLLTLLCLVAPMAFGATQLDALRGGAQVARAQLSTTRQGQLSNQTELNRLATRIEELKAHAKGKLTPGSELDGALKKSQELSAALTAAAAQLATQEATLESANLALLSELSSELARLRADFDRQTDRTARKQLIAKMRALRHERDQVRAALPAARVPALEAVKPSDDPEDLLEQADLLKDNEDKARRQLHAVEKRITEVREERDLDNRVRQFLGDESMFDEADRKLRVTRTTVTDSPAAANDPHDTFGGTSPVPHTRFTAGQGTGAYDFAAESVKGSPAPGAPPNATGVQGPSPTSGLGSGTNSDPGTRAADDSSARSPTTRTATGTDARPTVSNRIAGNDEDDDLEDLEIQRARLKGLADELKARASALQKKAAELR